MHEGRAIIDRELGGAPNLGSIGAMPEVPEIPLGVPIAVARIFFPLFRFGELLKFFYWGFRRE